MINRREAIIGVGAVAVVGASIGAEHWRFHPSRSRSRGRHRILSSFSKFEESWIDEWKIQSFRDDELFSTMWMTDESVQFHGGLMAVEDQIMSRLEKQSHLSIEDLKIYVVNTGLV